MSQKETAARYKSIPWNPVVALVIVIVLYFAAQIVGGLIVAAYPLASGWSEDRLNDWLQSSTAAQFYYVLVAEVFTVGVIYGFLRFYRQTLAVIGFKRPRWKDLGVGLLAYPVYFLLFAGALVVVTHFIPSLNVDQKQELGFDNVKGSLSLILTFVSLVILPPIAEEITVRGFLYTSLRKWLPLWPALLATSLAFAAAHLPEGGDAGPLYIGAIDTFLLSVVLCFVREKTDSLWAGIVVHALKNCVAFLTLYIFV